MPRAFLLLFLVVASVAAHAEHGPSNDFDPEIYERILFPVLTPPVFGAHGSEFVTELLLWSKEGEVHLWGLEPDCSPVICLGFDHPITGVAPLYQYKPVMYNGKPGRFAYVPRSQIDSLAANLRVFDRSRAGLNFGTDIPVVREREFTPGKDRQEQLVLVGVPLDRRFRKTLRIYSTANVPLKLTIDYLGGRTEERFVQLRPGTSQFDPAYAEISDLPTTPSGRGFFTLTISLDLHPINAFDFPAPIWAFVSVTNNETQMITTITPQP